MIQFCCKLRAHFYLSFAREGEKKLGDVQQRDDTRRKGSISSIHSEIVQHEFCISLIKIAEYKYITLAKKENALRKKKGYHTDILNHMHCIFYILNALNL